MADQPVTDNAETTAPKIKLFQFAPALGVPNASPFCVKLEAWLRIAGLEYDTVITPDPRKMPLGKLPAIEVDGKMVADSGCAIHYLQKHLDLKLDTQLNTVERGRALALTRMLEEHSYWALMYFRWLDEDNWPNTRKVFFGNMGGLMQSLVSGMVRRKMRRDALGQGLARHSRDQILHRFNEDMNALAANLGERPYFGGYQPATVDASAYGILCNVLHTNQRTVLADIAEQHASLVAYANRMRENYFPEFQ